MTSDVTDKCCFECPAEAHKRCAGCPEGRAPAAKEPPFRNIDSLGRGDHNPPIGALHDAIQAAKEPGVRRYSIKVHHDEDAAWRSCEDIDGDWVEREDHAAAVAALQAQVEAQKRYAGALMEVIGQATADIKMDRYYNDTITDIHMGVAAAKALLASKAGEKPA